MAQQTLVEPLDPRMESTLKDLFNSAGNTMLFALAKAEAAEPGAQKIIVKELEKGSRLRLVIDTNPHAVSVQVLQLDGNSEQIFAYHLGGC